MEGNFCLNQLIVNTANEFFEKHDGVDVVSPHVLRQNYTQEGILKHIDRGLVPHIEHNEYESTVFLMQND